MRPRHDLKAPIRLIAIAVLAVAVVAAVIRVRRSEERGVVAHEAPPSETSLAAQLARCRGVMPAQLALDHSCERVWAENRKQFFASGQTAFFTSHVSGVSGASLKPRNFPAVTASASHSTATDVTPPDSFGSLPPLKDAPEPAKQQPVIIRSNSSAAAPGEK